MTATRRRQRRTQIQKLREQERKLARDLKALQKRRARTRERIKSSCARGRAKASATVKALRDAERKELALRAERIRMAARSQCNARCRRAKTAYKTKQARLKAEKRAKQAEIEALQKANALDYTPAELRKLRRAQERRQETTEAALNDIPEDLHVVFRRVRRTLPKPTKRADGTTRTSLAERFLEWVEEHPDETALILDAKAERDAAKLIAQHEKAQQKLYEAQQRALRKAGYTPGEAAALRELGLVPGGASPPPPLSAVPF